MRLGKPLPPQVQTFNRFLIQAKLMNEAKGPRTFEPRQTLKNGHLPTEEELPIQDGKLKKLVAPPKIDLPGIQAKEHSVLIIESYVMHVVRLVTTRSIAGVQAKVKTKVKTKVKRK